MIDPAELWRQAVLDARRGRWEQLLDQQLAAVGLPPGQPEFCFAPPRRWRFDRAWPELLVAVEVEGVTGGDGGRHQRRDGFARDCEKYNAAALAGWTLLRFTPRQIRTGAALRTLEVALGS